MNKGFKVLLILVALVCFGVALSYPIRYEMETRSNTQTMERLMELRQAGLQRAAQATAQPETAEPEPERQGISVTTDETQNAEAEAVPGNGAAPLTREADNGQSSTAPENPAPVVDEWRESENAPESGVSDGNAPGESQNDVTQPLTAENAEQAASADGATQVAPQGEATQPAQQAAQGTEQTHMAIAGVLGQTGTAVQAAPEAWEPGEESSVSALSGDETSVTVLSGDESSVAVTSGAATPAPTPVPTPTPSPSPTPDRSVRSGALPYPLREHIALDESLILPQYRELYELNHDLVGWITIQGTDIDYPVVQNEVNDYYLRRDFFGEENKNGQIILDTLCDPYTPSYNLIISGHNMRNESMFSTLVNYFRYKEDWSKHKFVQFDSLMEERLYVVLAAFFAVDYDVYGEGFRYNADIQYKIDADLWLAEVRENQLYNTGIEAEFGDEFLTLTTCNSQRKKNGRFVVICRRLREGETIE